MRDIAAITGAAIGLSAVGLRLYAYFSAVSLCQQALQSGQAFEAKVRWWSLALELRAGTVRSDDQAASES